MKLTRALMLIFLPLKTQKGKPERKKAERLHLYQRNLPADSGRKLKEEEKKLFTQGVDPHLHYKVALV